MSYKFRDRRPDENTEFPILFHVSLGRSKDVASLRPPSTKRRRKFSSVSCAVAVSGSFKMDSICSANASYCVLLRLMLQDDRSRVDTLV